MTGPPDACQAPAGAPTTFPRRAGLDPVRNRSGGRARTR